MLTDRDIHEPPELAPDAAVDAPRPVPVPDHTTATTGASQPHDEATMRAWEGLPPDTMILAPAFAAPPMRCPDDVWAMLVTAVDIISDADPDRAGEVALFTGSWVREQPPADRLYDGDLVVRLTHPADPTYPLPRDHAADVEMLLAYQGRWQRVGHWCGVDDRWPRLVAPTAAAVMGLHCDLSETSVRFETVPPPISSPPITWAQGGVAELLDAGLVTAGDELVWDRRRLCVRHTARIRIDGALVLADGRAYANPTSATNALGGYNNNGWNAFRRVSDGRTSGDLRTELRARAVAPASRPLQRPRRIRSACGGHYRNTADPAARRSLSVTRFESTVDFLILWGRTSRDRSRLHPGGRRRATGADIAELRDDGGIPVHVRTVITVLPQQRVLRSGSRASRSRPTRTAPPSGR
jgi:hypothetical protein